MKTKGILYQEYEPTPDNPCEIKGLNLLYADEEVNKRIEVYDDVIADLKQENKQLKDRINKAAEYIYDEDILKILKEDNKEKVDDN